MPQIGPSLSINANHLLRANRLSAHGSNRSIGECFECRSRGSLADLPRGSADMVFCMEVFEHLPEKETLNSLDAIDQLMRCDGRAIIGVPVEVFLPALFKGMFRMVRRYGDVDATVWNVFRASVGAPPRNRPVGMIADGLPYHFRHMGFDYRRFVKILRDRFAVQKTRGSPVTLLPPWLNNEVYYVLAKTTKPAA